MQMADKVKVIGKVIEALPQTQFRVEMADKTIIAYLSGKMYMNHIRVLPGDRVEMELAPTGDRARIFKRL